MTLSPEKVWYDSLSIKEARSIVRKFAASYLLNAQFHAALRRVLNHKPRCKGCREAAKIFRCTVTMCVPVVTIPKHAERKAWLEKYGSERKARRG
jgi:hypothetical protein